MARAQAVGENHCICERSIFFKIEIEYILMNFLQKFIIEFDIKSRCCNNKYTATGIVNKMIIK